MPVPPAVPPTVAFAVRYAAGAATRERITADYRREEADAVRAVTADATLTPAQLAVTQQLATKLADGVRASRTKAGGVDALMLEFSLDSREGIALMCLAEALLRIPDAATRDRLIRDKIAQGDWRSHVGRSPSLFVNAAAWGLLVTGKLVDSRSESTMEQAVASVLRKGGEPLIRKGVDLAMRLLGKQFVTGRTIDEALVNAREREARGYRYSFDMLGEAALTSEDARHYFAAYETAIHAIGKASAGAGVYAGPGISIKLSALHPRYSRAQRARVLAELVPSVARLAQLARGYDIGLNIDAEEADRLDLSLDIFEALAADPALAGWNGLGFVVQAYQKRSRAVIDWLVEVARRNQRRLMVRLVKGAYWDTEIKRAQVDGMSGYPVFTRKVHTDIAYMACAGAMLAAPDAIYPQFASHNAFTIAAISTLARDADYEFQCLHGMGESLYDQVVGNEQWGSDLPAGPSQEQVTPPPAAATRRNRERGGPTCRIYAPVGSHETLLAYLVRRLLENGANTSFVNRIVDPNVNIAELVADPVALANRTGGTPHPRIALPLALYPDRRNSQGIDFSDESALRALDMALANVPAQFEAAPMLGDKLAESRYGTASANERVTITNPCDRRDVVGTVVEATVEDVAQAITIAASAGAAWSAVPASERAACLERAADLLEDERATLIALATREAGKTLPNAVSEVREAADFCRYYAAQARQALGNAKAIGPIACIAPWNFPLAIFVGQVSAALAAGNAVLAKPAEQTPLMAAAAVRLLHRAGVPAAALQLLPGRGETVGAALVADPRIAGVLFTGSTAVAQLINRTLAQREGDAVLVAETGGQNAMVVDSSALPEQVVADVLASAYDSAGQRCSALRILCVQDDIAERVIAMLKGAMAELRVGNTSRLDTDVGPVIDAEARDLLEAHVARMRAAGADIHQLPLPEACANGTFFPPTLIAIDDVSTLTSEVFGPVLHVVRFRQGQLEPVLDAINATGYGLTHGVQTRIDETVETVIARIRAGNIYVNRNIVGAVVGVQPFGGDRMSGTGPKAGGPHYLWRLVDGRPPPLAAAVNAGDVLAGPTGETNTLYLRPRGRIACIANDEGELAAQARVAIATGNVALLEASESGTHVRALLRHGCQLVKDPLSAEPDAVLFAGSAEQARQMRQTLAARPGPIVPLIVKGVYGYDPTRLLSERTVTINTTASGGNASLLSLTETPG